MRTVLGASSAIAVACTVSFASADLVGVQGGQTNVLLDFELIEAATGLALGGVSDGVIVPGNLGEGSVAFAITGPDAAVMPTTFAYDTADFFKSFSGTIEHRGSVSFTGSAAGSVNYLSIIVSRNSLLKKSRYGIFPK